MIFVDYILQDIHFDTLWSQYHDHAGPSCDFSIEVSNCPNTDPILAQFEPSFELNIRQGTATAITQVVKARKDTFRAKVNIAMIYISWQHILEKFIIIIIIIFPV